MSLQSAQSSGHLHAFKSALQMDFSKLRLIRPLSKSTSCRGLEFRGTTPLLSETPCSKNIMHALRLILTFSDDSCVLLFVLPHAERQSRSF